MSKVERYGSQPVSTHGYQFATFDENDRKKAESLRAQAERYKDTVAPASPPETPLTTKCAIESKEMTAEAPGLLTRAYNYLINMLRGNSNDTIQKESGASLMASPYSGTPKLQAPSERKSDLARLERLATFMKEMQKSVESIQEIATEEIKMDPFSDNANGHFAYLNFLKRYDKDKQNTHLCHAEEVTLRFQSIQENQKAQNELTIKLEETKFYSDISDKVKSASGVLLGLSAVFEGLKWTTAFGGQPALALPAKLIAMTLVGINSGTTLLAASLDNKRIDAKGKVDLIQQSQDTHRHQIKDLNHANKLSQEQKTKGISSAAETFRKMHEMIQQVSNV